MRIIPGPRSAAAGLLLLALTLLIWLLLYTPLGLRWAARLAESQLPSTRIVVSEGRLIDSASFDRIQWQDPDFQVSASHLEVHWDARCLWLARLCIKRLHSDSLHLTLPLDDQSVPAQQQLELPQLSAPVAINIDSLTVNHLKIEGPTATRIDSIAARLRWQGAMVSVDSLALDWQNYHLEAAGDVELNNRYPLKLAINVLNRTASPAAGDAKQTVSIANINAKLDGNLDQLQVAAQASLSSVWLGPGDLKAKFSWSREMLTIEDVSLDSFSGGLTANGSIGLTGVRQFELDIDLVELTPILDSLPRPLILTGPLTAFGQWPDSGLPDFSVDTNVAAVYGTTPVDIRGRGRYAGTDAIYFEGLELIAGTEKLRLDGLIGDKLDLHAMVTVVDLQKFIPAAGGAINADLRVKGSRDAPTIRGQARAKNIAYGEFQVRQVELTASDDRIDLVLGQLRQARTEIDSIQASLSGQAEQHQITVKIGEPRFGAAVLNCSGGLLEGNNWRAQCDHLSLQLKDLADSVPWELAEPVELNWQQQQKQLSIAAFCLHRLDASLCNNSAAIVTSETANGLDLEFAALPLAWLRQLGLIEADIDGKLRGALRGSWIVGAVPELEGNIEISSLSIASQSGAQPWLPQLHSLYAAASIDGQQIQTGFGLNIGAGQAVGELSIDTAAPDRKVQGRVFLNKLQLAEFAGIDPQIEDLEGRVDGTVQLGGLLNAPLLSGTINLSAGRLQHRLLPYPVDAFELAVNFDGAQVDFAGTLQTTSGRGSIDGNANWSDPKNWQAQLRTDLTGLVIVPLEGSEIELNPKIDVLVTPGLLDLTGTVKIPRADIKLDALPRGAETVSRDTIIVGREPAEGSWQWQGRLGVELGEAVSVHGYGGEASLAGTIELSGNSDNPLSGDGEFRITYGTYRAYGQRLLVRDGSLLFVGPVDNPDIRLDAIREFTEDDVIVGIRASGPVRNPILEVFSEPHMGETEAMHYLLTGRGPGGSGDVNSQMVNDALLGLGASQATRGLGDVARDIGIDDFRVSTGSGAGGTEVQLSGYITPDLFIRYGMGVYDRVNTLRLRYRLRDKLYLEIVSGLESAADLIYSFER